MSLENRSVLVTGGAGFIGSNLVDALLERNCRVTVLDNLSSGNINNLAHIADRITFVEGDIRNRKLLAELLQGVDVVFHQAAMVSVPQTVEEPIESAEVNDMGTTAGSVWQFTTGHVPGDADEDGDVDLEDFGSFQVCMSGFGEPQTDPDCGWADVDGDTDVDGGDLEVLQVCMSGPNVPADPYCGT